MNIEKIKKTSKSRLENVDTYKIVCDDPEKYIQATRTLKSANEVGSGINDFVHVALKRECVIKVHFTKSMFTKNEINIMKLIKDKPYVVKHICTYSCLDDKKRWMEHPQHNKESLDQLTFMIMDYIPNGDVANFLKNATKQQIKALFIQCAFAMIDMAETCSVSQGDFNSGNVLVSTEKPTTKKINIGKKQYTFNTHGVKPLFIDFGRGYIRETKAKYIIEDIMTLFLNYIPDVQFQNKLNDMIFEILEKPKPRFSHIFEPLFNLS